MSTPQGRSRNFIAVVAAMLVLALAGCETAIAGAARTATPAAIQGGIEGLTAPKTEADLQRLFASPEVKAALRELTAAMTDGAFQSLDEATKTEKLQQILDRISAHVVPRMAREALPFVDGALRSAVRSALDEASTDRSIAQARKIMLALADAKVDAINKRAASGLRDELGPAFAEVLKTQIGPALAEVMKKEIGPALSTETLSATSREVGKSFILGANDALGDIDKSGRSIVERAVAAHAGTFPWMMVVIAVLATAVVGLSIAMVAEARRTARVRRTLLVLAAGLEDDERASWNIDLLEALSDGSRDPLLERRLASVLSSRRAKATHGDPRPRAPSYIAPEAPAE